MTVNPEVRELDQDGHHSRLTELVSQLLEDGLPATQAAWGQSREIPRRDIDSHIRCAEIKTIFAPSR